MAKYKTGFFLQLNRNIFSYPGLSLNARWLYCVLSELEHKFTGKGNKDWFFRTDRDLSVDSGMSESSLYRARKELIDAGFIKVQKARYKNADGCKSTFAVNAYTIS